MPRKKRVQPRPLRNIEGDEFFIEVRDRTTALIGRGLHAIDDFDETLDEISDYITPEAFIRKSDKNLYFKEPACLVLEVFDLICRFRRCSWHKNYETKKNRADALL